MIERVRPVDNFEFVGFVLMEEIAAHSLEIVYADIAENRKANLAMIKVR